jgi:hypothetical protein
MTTKAQMEQMAKVLGPLGMLVSYLPSHSCALVRANLAVTIRSAYGPGKLETMLLNGMDNMFVEIEKAGSINCPEISRGKRMKQGAA